MNPDILMVFADTAVEWNCSEWRIRSPSYGLRRLGATVDEMWLNDWSQSHRDKTLMDRVAKADVVLLQRNCFGGALDALRYWRGRGKPVYIDLDDAYNMLPQTVSAHRFWTLNAHSFKPPPLDQLREGLRLSNGLTSPSKLILEDWEAPAKVWLPNFVRAEWYRDVERRPHEGIIIGWGGSMSHYDSMRYSGAVAALTEICRKYPYVRLAMCGNDRNPYEMLTEIPAQQKLWQPGVPQHEWPNVVAQFDIGLAPLFGEYDRRRSWLKVVEYACAGVPCIVSKSDPYVELSEWCFAQVEDGPEPWFAALDTAISSVAQAKAVAYKRRVAAVLEFSIESKAGVWLEGLTP